MAREHANIRLDMWGDADWRALSRDAQWLYMMLLTHPDTNRAGVCDWRPGRIAKMANGVKAADVKKIATELERGLFVVIDEDTEEILVRSYVKYDGVLKQPNLTVTMVNDWCSVASERLRAVVAFEVQKLRAVRPEMPAWKVERIATLVETPGLDVRRDPSGNPSVDPSGDPKPDPTAEGELMGASTLTATYTATNASHSRAREAKKPELRLPKSWAPNASHIERAKTAGIDVMAEAEAFRLHAETHDRHAANWNAAFTTWLTKSRRTGAGALSVVDGVQLRPGEELRDGIVFRDGRPRIGGENGMTVEQYDAWREARFEHVGSR